MTLRPNSDPSTLLALVALAGGAPLLLLAFLLGGPWGNAAAALLVGLLPAALLALGVASKLRRLRRRLVLWLLLSGLSSGVFVVYLTTSGSPAGWWVGGFPLPTALLIYGVGLGLLLATGLFYAVVFDRLGIDRNDLKRLERIAAERGGRKPGDDA